LPSLLLHPGYLFGFALSGLGVICDIVNQ
jgi:hypothetical protein